VIRAAGIVAVSLALLGAGSAQALTLQPIDNFAQPIYLTSDPGDATRLFVVERQGRIKLVEGGVVSEFANLESVVSCCSLERGLLSIALAPDFHLSGRLYVFYTGKLEAPGEIHVAELQASGSSAPIGTLRNVLTISHPEDSNHYGGQLQFGLEGNLFISTGDGGGPNDKHQNAQSRTSLLGKILRIDPRESSVLPYSVPADNPFAGEPDPGNTIWSYGLRNPYRFSFDALTGDMAIGDVGDAKREEVDFAPSPFPGLSGGGGANYGWNCREGFILGLATDPQCATPPPAGFTEPVFDYTHFPDPDLGGSSRCAITGGYVARDPALGALYGHYVYSDYCSGTLRALQLPASANGRAGGDCSLGLEVDGPVSFGEDAAHRLYLVEQSGGVYRLAGLPPPNCPAPPQQSSPETRKQGAPTFVGIKAQRRRVERGRRALLTVFVSPCSGRRGQTVSLLRTGHANGTRFLSRACTARFVPQIHRGTKFVATVREESGYLPGKSRRLTIRLAHHRHHRHQG
jgi:Glucose / Sorbosone dehydrogenase